MTFDNLLVFATLIIAAYSVVPEYKRLELKLRWGVLDWALLFGAIILIHYLLFFQFFKKLGFSPCLNFYKLNITPRNAANLSLLFFSSIIAKLCNMDGVLARLALKVASLKANPSCPPLT